MGSACSDRFFVRDRRGPLSATDGGQCLRIYLQRPLRAGDGLHTDPDSSDGDSFGYHHYYLYLPLYARDLPSYSPNTNWYLNNTTIGGIGLGWLPATGSAKVFSLNGQSIYYALYNTSMLAASSIDFGRVMAGSYQSTKLWVSRTGEGTALISSATAEGPLELIVHNTVVDDTPRGIDVILDTGATGKLADSKITLVNTANNVYGPQTLTASVGGTVVANREVTGEADIRQKGSGEPPAHRPGGYHVRGGPG